MSVLQFFNPITAFAFDVDGVLTDGKILLFENGEHARTMNIKDGYALQLAIKKGYHVVVISGAVSAAVKLRLNKLGIEAVFMGIQDKKDFLDTYLTENNLNWKDLLFMGDDIPDHAAMLNAGLACAPADAVPEIRHIARYISTSRGGEGCVRDVIEKVLKLNGHWELDTSVTSR
ncbi:MAG: KdsC family phosphatase [Chitinophagales bacterium]